MGDTNWLTERTTRAVTVTGDFVEVKVGLIGIPHAGPQVVLRVGDQPVMVLPDDEAVELSAACREAYAAKLKAGS